MIICCLATQFGFRAHNAIRFDLAAVEKNFSPRLQDKNLGVAWGRGLCASWLSMLKLIRRSVLVHRESWTVRQSSGAVEMEASIQGSYLHINCVNCVLKSVVEFMRCSHVYQ